MILVLLVGVVSFVSLFYKKSKLYRYISSLRFTILISALATIMMIVEGIWAVKLHKTIPFIVLMTLFIVNLVAVLYKKSFKGSRDRLFIITHMGILIVLIGSVFGAPDKLKHKMIVGYDTGINRAYDLDMTVRDLSFSAQLEAFDQDNFMSEVTFEYEGVKKTKYIKVNSPIKYQGYKVYQDSYDTKSAVPKYVVLLLVRDHWWWFTRAGLMLLLLGGVMMLFTKKKTKL